MTTEPIQVNMHEAKTHLSRPRTAGWATTA
jgi:hypothetical protein